MSNLPVISVQVDRLSLYRDQLWFAERNRYRSLQLIFLIWRTI